MSLITRLVQSRLSPPWQFSAPPGSSAMPANAVGATLTVDNLTDNPALSVCSANPGDCSLRGAIVNANANPDVNTIVLQANQTYNFMNPVTPDEDNDMTGDLDIKEPVIITGNGATVNAAGGDRVFDIFVDADETVTFNNLTIKGGSLTSPAFDGGGAGIRQQNGSLELNNVTVTHNTVSGFALGGGGIFTGGDVHTLINSSTISFNTASSNSAFGGAFAKPDGTGSLEVHDSTFDHNEAGNSGAGVYIGLSSVGGVSFFDTTFTNNIAHVDCTQYAFNCTNGGGAIFAPAEAINITGGVVSNNSAPLSSAGAVYAPTIHVDGTTLDANSAAGYGGAIDSFDPGSTITNATITNNQAKWGGGLAFANGSITQTTISGNRPASTAAASTYPAAPQSTTPSSPATAPSTKAAASSSSATPRRLPTPPSPATRLLSAAASPVAMN